MGDSSLRIRLFPKYNGLLGKVVSSVCLEACKMKLRRGAST